MIFCLTKRKSRGDGVTLIDLGTYFKSGKKGVMFQSCLLRKQGELIDASGSCRSALDFAKSYDIDGRRTEKSCSVLQRLGFTRSLPPPSCCQILPVTFSGGDSRLKIADRDAQRGRGYRRGSGLAQLAV